MFISQNEDNPKYWRFKQNPNNPSFFCIYTKQKKSEAIAAESELPTAVQGTTEEGAAGSQEPSCSMVTIALMTKVVDDEPPRSNTIVGKESSKHNYIFDVRFTAVRMVRNKVLNFLPLSIISLLKQQHLNWFITGTDCNSKRAPEQE